MNKIFKNIEDSPLEITISKWWKPGGGMMILREALPVDHEENEYNWFRKNYPDLNPSYYGIKNPIEERFENLSREELIDMILMLEKGF